MQVEITCGPGHVTSNSPTLFGWLESSGKKKKNYLSKVHIIKTADLNV